MVNHRNHVLLLGNYPGTLFYRRCHEPLTFGHFRDGHNRCNPCSFLFEIGQVGYRLYRTVPQLTRLRTWSIRLSRILRVCFRNRSVTVQALHVGCICNRPVRVRPLYGSGSTSWDFWIGQLGYTRLGKTGHLGCSPNCWATKSTNRYGKSVKYGTTPFSYTASKVGQLECHPSHKETLQFTFLQTIRRTFWAHLLEWPIYR